MNNQIRVDMTPNPLDLKTLHCSQGDTEARTFKFELHNNGETVDVSGVREQIAFKAYKDGTEEIQPVNGSVPVTSPFKGDIKYPQGLLTDQEFTYRQSPTESDGLAKITDIKGNTLVWNQLCKTLTSGNWAIVGAGSGTLTFADGVATFSTTNNYGRFLYTPGNLVSGHKYLLSVEIKAYANARIIYALGSQNIFGSQGCVCSTVNVQDANWHRYTSVGTFTSGTDDKVLVQNNSGASNLHEIQVRNIMYFDLTQMGLDITDPSDFTSLFSLPYYAYNQGSLLSFNGNGIKTVGFNQWDEEWEVGAYNSADGTKADNVRDRIRNKNPIRVFPSVNYYKNKGLQVYYVYYYDASMNFIGWNSLANQGIFTPPSNACYMNFNGLANTGTTYNNDICINISDANKNGTYEPYTSSTTSLPISTYFPTGMKSAGAAYDELTPIKAITKIGIVDLGTLNWTYSSTTGHLYFNSVDISTLVKKTSASGVYANIVCQKYNVINENEAYSNVKVGIGIMTSGSVRVYDPTYTNVADFKTAMSGVYLYYELATPTETSFATASLVTENAEIPLSNEDGVLIGKCTEQLSENPGFIDAKIKLSDSDGECYSNKLQLHVERSPQ